MSLFTVYYEFELEVEADCTNGVAPITWGPPDFWRQGESPTAEITKVYIIDGDNKTELQNPTDTLLEMLTDQVLEQC